MDTPEITPETLTKWLEENDKNAKWLADQLKVSAASVSRWLNGKQTIGNTDQALLRLLLWNQMPFAIVGITPLKNHLEFTPDQWRVIGILARREGITEAKWIGNRIRDYLTWDTAARAETNAPQTTTLLVADAPDAPSSPSFPLQPLKTPTIYPSGKASKKA
jgi:DNA-binding MarR family transcriptional regulator